MTTIEWENVKAIFNEALAHPRGEREAFVRVRCERDAATRDEVLSLLAAADERTPSPDLPPAAVFSAAADRAVAAAIDDRHSDPATLVGRDIGPYRILSVLGKGGMGIVYKAERRAPHMFVAIKLLRRSLLTSRTLARVRHEAEVMAHLRHEHIARVLDFGTFEHQDDRLPYLVLEFIPGARPIDAFADEHAPPLDTRSRLGLMARVCRAVAHAHSLGVIHRDLKPGNILIDDASPPQPKIIDFGIARATDADLSITLPGTEMGQIIGTLQYASPEQCSGDPAAVGTRSDIYSLGVILYQLVCGRAPYQVDALSITEALAVVKERLPDPPTLGQAKSKVHPDLGAVIHKVLEKDPARRYQSADALAADIEAHLAGQPTAARPPGPFRRLVAAAARRPMATAVSAGAMIIVLSVLMAWTAVWWTSRQPVGIDIDPDNRRVSLRSRIGGELHSWNSHVLNGIGFGEMVSRPTALGGGNVVLVAFDLASQTGDPGELCGFDADDPARMLWSTANCPLTLPPGELGHGESGMRCRNLLIADVFPELPGQEIVALHEIQEFAATAIRIFDLAGGLHYVAWHDGSIASSAWLADARLLVFAGVNSADDTWAKRGFRGNSAGYPIALFAVAPLDGRTDFNDWVIRRGRNDDPTLVWYRWLGPAEIVAAAPTATATLGALTGAISPRAHAKLQVRFGGFKITDPLLAITVDASAREVSRFRDWLYESAAAKGDLPDPAVFKLFDGDSLPPRVQPTSP